MVEKKGNPKLDSEYLQSLRVEYQAAQDSAHHHDNVIATTTSIVWGGELLLIAVVAQSIIDGKLPKIPIIVISILSMLMLGYLWMTVSQSNYVKKEKYRRCKKIEEILNLEQHSKLNYPEGRATILYRIIMFAFILTWLSILYITVSG